MPASRWFPLLAPALALAAACSAQATTVGPDSYGYTATDASAYIFQDITATGTKVLAGVDDQTFAAAIGFGFNLYGTNYTTAYLSSNGLVSFGGANNDYSNNDLRLNQFSGGPVFASYWDDLVTYGADPARGVYYQTVGTPGNRNFIVQEIANAYSAGGASINFETVFSESGSILVRYNQTTFGNDHDQGRSSTVGLQGDLALGQVVQWEYNTAGSIVDNTSLCFSVGGVACGVPLIAPPAPGGTVPEPAPLGLLGIGLVGAVALRRRRR